MRILKQSTAAAVMVLMTDSSDHVTGKTGLILSVTSSKGAAVFASISPVVTERGAGWYAMELTTAHTDTLGDLVLHVTAAAADPTDVILCVMAGSLDADISSRLPTAGYTAPPTPAAIGAAVWAISLETGFTAAQLMSLLSAVMAGKVSGGGTATVTFRDLNDTESRVVATVDANGNRTAITLNPAS